MIVSLVGDIGNRWIGNRHGFQPLSETKEIHAHRANTKTLQRQDVFCALSIPTYLHAINSSHDQLMIESLAMTCSAFLGYLMPDILSRQQFRYTTHDQWKKVTTKLEAPSMSARVGNCKAFEASTR